MLTAPFLTELLVDAAAAAVWLVVLAWVASGRRRLARDAIGPDAFRNGSVSAPSRRGRG